MSENSASENNVSKGDKPPILVLTCQRDSHPFQDRTIAVTDVIKVGRSVARAKPLSTNATFDCKVLSRSHALIWYKNERFTLRDTNSSNGTFVNNTRVVKKAEDEHAEREIFSGDVIRFGVEVVENEITHGCIIARVTLYHPDGSEAKPSVGFTGSPLELMAIETLHSEQVFRLAHFVTEALFHEELLDSKLTSLNQLLQETREISDTSWQVILNEERLLQKLDLYESQLSLLKLNLSPDSLQARLCQVLEDKINLEKASEMMLNRLVNEKTEALAKVTNLEYCLSDSDQERARLWRDCEATQAAYQSITKDYDAKISELKSLEKQLKDVQMEKGKIKGLLGERTKNVDDSQINAGPVNSPLSKLVSTNQPIKADFGPSVNGLDYGLPPSGTDGLSDHPVISNAEYDTAMDSLSSRLSEQLLDCVHQFRQSLQLTHSLQDQLALLSQIQVIQCRRTKPIKSDSFPNHSPSTADTNGPSQMDDVLAPWHTDDPLAVTEFFSETFARANKLALQIADCHQHAVTRLVSFCTSQEPPKIPSVCNTSGDVCLPLPAIPSDGSNFAVKADEYPVSLNTIPVTPALTAASDVNSTFSTSSLTPQLVDSEAQSSSDDCELLMISEQLRLAQDEALTCRNLAERFKQQDDAKAELLQSVRSECDILRKRIAHIEADVASSREDHQRLIAEARRTQTEADELREERDALNEQVITCSRRIEQLQSSLTLTAAFDLPEKDLPLIHARVVENRIPFRLSESPPARLGSAAPTPGSMLPLFVIIPIMFLLCAIMAYVFTKFSG